MAEFIRSVDIEVFPAVHRTNAYVKSKRTTEENLIKFGKLSSNKQNLSQMFLDPDDATYVIFNIAGYWFRCLVSKVPTGANLNAYIKLIRDSSLGYILSPTDGSSIGGALDDGIDPDFYFKGLSFTSDAIPSSVTDVLFYGFKIRDASGILMYQNLKLDANEIRNDADDITNKAISQKFDTELLVAGAVNGLTIDTSSGTLDIANGKTVAANASLTVGATPSNTGDVSIKSSDNNPTTITAPGNGSVTLFAGEMVEKNKEQTLTTKTLTSPIINIPDINGGAADALASLSIRDTSAAYDVTIAATSSTPLTAGHKLTLDLVNADKTLKLNGSPTLSGITTTGAGTLNLNKNLTISNDNNFTLTADGADRTLKISGADKEVAGAATALTFGGNFSTTGAYTTVLNQAGNVTLTLPATSQTLATLAGSEAFTNKTINGLTVTSTVGGTLAIANSKTAAISDTLTIYKPLYVGATSVNTGAVAIKSAGSSATTIIGPNNGTATLISGIYTTAAITEPRSDGHPDSLVMLDGYGNFSANMITADLTGTASKATADAAGNAFRTSYGGSLVQGSTNNKVKLLAKDGTTSLGEVTVTDVNQAANATNTSFTNTEWVTTTAIDGTMPTGFKGKTYQLMVVRNGIDFINFGIMSFIDVGGSAYYSVGYTYSSTAGSNYFHLRVIVDGTICCLLNGTRIVSDANYKLYYKEIK